MVFLWLMHWSHLATLEFDNIFAAVPEVNGGFAPVWGGGDVHCAPVFLAEHSPRQRQLEHFDCLMLLLDSFITF